MPIIDETVQVDDSPGEYHIPGVHNMQNTLCGFVDVNHTMVSAYDHPCNCAQCIDALKDIKAMRFMKNYFVKPQ